MLSAQSFSYESADSVLRRSECLSASISAARIFSAPASAKRLTCVSSCSCARARSCSISAAAAALHAQPRCSLCPWLPRLRPVRALLAASIMPAASRLASASCSSTCCCATSRSWPARSAAARPSAILSGAPPWRRQSAAKHSAYKMRRTPQRQSAVLSG